MILRQTLRPAVRIVRRWWQRVSGYQVRAYSQEGEDLILARLFERKTDGFYVDVGAHHPQRFSNTYLFYRRGWKGINIDALPGSMTLFKRIRSRDINLEMAVALTSGKLTYYAFNEPALNTFDSELAKQREANVRYRLETQIDLPTERLDRILTQYLPAGQHIDFMSVDVEGLDFDVLQSNDWTHFRPTYVLVERLSADRRDICGVSPTIDYLAGQGYSLFAHTVNTAFFYDTNRQE